MAIISQSIEKKRGDALIRIGQNALGTSLAGAVPTPALETTKMLGIALADAWMFWDIYKIYYNRKLSASRLVELLKQAGIVVVTGGVVGYATVKVSQTVMGELFNIVPLVGWFFNGVLIGSTSVVIGLAWMAYVEDRYRAQKKAVPVEMESSTGEKKVRIAINGPSSAPEPPVTLSTNGFNGHHMDPTEEDSADS